MCIVLMSCDGGDALVAAVFSALVTTVLLVLLAAGRALVWCISRTCPEPREVRMAGSSTGDGAASIAD